MRSSGSPASTRSPQYVSTLDRVTPIAAQVKVDLELWGCPVSGRQILAALRALLSGVVPLGEEDKVCMECKRRQTVCVMVTQGVPCMGPVTRTGCGAICPAFGRDCYACYGPAENVNTQSLSRRLEGLGLTPRSGGGALPFHRQRRARISRRRPRRQGGEA